MIEVELIINSDWIQIRPDPATSLKKEMQMFILKKQIVRKRPLGRPVVAFQTHKNSKFMNYRLHNQSHMFCTIYGIQSPHACAAHGM